MLVGSSMGGWLSLLLAQRRPERVSGVMGIAAAPDFSTDTYDHQFTDAQRQTVEKEGVIYIPSAYGAPYPLTKKLFDDAKQYLLLNKTTPLPIPLRLIQGKKDDAVPWKKAEKIKQSILSTDTEIIYVEDGDHRLSRPEYFALIGQTLDKLNKKLVL